MEVFLLAAVVAAVGFAAHAILSPNLANIAAKSGLALPVVQSAAKWSRARGLPLAWVLATIIVESGGRVRDVGDGGKSVGLMQVNTSAHADEMHAAGVTREDLFGIDKNIEWGTKIFKDIYVRILQALGGRSPPIPMDVIIRLAYKGPTTVVNALRRGQNPLTIAWAPEAIVNWRRALTRTSALV